MQAFISSLTAMSCSEPPQSFSTKILSSSKRIYITLTLALILIGQYSLISLNAPENGCLSGKDCPFIHSYIVTFNCDPNTYSTPCWLLYTCLACTHYTHFHSYTTQIMQALVQFSPQTLISIFIHYAFTLSYFQLHTCQIRFGTASPILPKPISSSLHIRI